MKSTLPPWVFKKHLCLFLSFVVFSLTVFAQPANDNCAASITRTSNGSCTKTYDINNATASGGIPVGCAAAGTHYDVWFQFTAISSTHSIDITISGSNFTNPEIQLFSGTCGALVSQFCGATSLTATGLIIGNTYYVRVSKVGGAAVTSNSNFKICITHPGTPPQNDECTAATSLTSNTSCNNTQYDMRYAAVSAGIPVGCASAGLHYDMWFKFTAVSVSQTASISSLGSGFNNPEIQLFSGSCASLTSLACGTTSVTGTGLTIGNTYYVRISNVGTMPTVSGANRFNICLTHPNPPPVNDDCSNATILLSNATCTNTAGNLLFATSNGPAGACGTGVTAANTFDVWYRFQAGNTNQTVSVATVGKNLQAISTYMQVLSGSCGSMVSLGCQTVATNNGRLSLTGLTVGSFYYVRIYVLVSPTAGVTTDWNFDICVRNPPANDECVGAVVLTPGATCTNTVGSLDLATVSAGIPIGCTTAGSYDVWYRFTATGVSSIINLSNLGASVAPGNVRIQVLTGTCAGLVSVGCVIGTSITQVTTNGTSYYVRIAFPTNISAPGSVASFSICVTNGLVPPANDLCSGAILLTSGTTCNNILGTFIRATATASLPACGNNGSSDVWYAFVAQSAYPTITLSNVGINLSTASPRIQVFSGSCGSLTQVGTCSTSPYTAFTVNSGAGLKVGDTYYVRITTNTSMAPPTAGAWTFNICITDPILGTAIDYSKSYVNVTDGTIGGPIDVGDELEIRAILVVGRPGNAGAVKAIDSVAFYDTLRAGMGFGLQSNRMALRTNEGKLFRPTNSTYFTDAYDPADAAWITTSGAGSDTSIQMNMGLNATYTSRGKIRTNSRPSNFGNTCIIMATYRVTVNAPYGTEINYGGGAFRYRDSATGVFYTIQFPEQKLMVYASPGACPDATSPTNVIGDEFSGSFGQPTVSAGSQNRGTSANTDYGYKAFNPAGPDDYFYAVANNTSANNTAVQTLPKGNAARVFNVWDITGDHTGATNTAKGNLPCNAALPISPTNPCGYMLIINSAYRTDAAFKFNVNGACEETYYEISGWFKNICYKCGCDSAGNNGSSGYIPTAPGDSAGVRPNIAFQINGVDHYTTGDLVYQGLGGTQTGSDTLNKWVKRSFVYRTKPGETGFSITFRNNAPGGGGNDWALDDISIRTCYPNMIYSPSSAPSVCTGRILTITDTVRSYYNVYIHYKWQRSTDGGASWVDIPGATGVANTSLNPALNVYEYVNAYTLPRAWTTMANNGDLYRMMVATTSANLASGCSYSDVTPVTITVLNNCVDIDDDNDGMPDYVEFNNPVALQSTGGIPNWSNPAYPGFIDNNADGVNDNFDYGADSDGDGVPNYLDPLFPGFIDTNADGVNDKADKDLDGTINQYDLDSDNDGIPDVVESYGVDQNGDGIIDNYTDTDADGFSQNLDANNLGVAGSSIGLGTPDLDLDGIPNYLDTDSDNDGIPDVVEVLGPYTTNNGKLSNFIDATYDGLSDNNVNGTALLLTGPDADGNGRADNFPFKNLDRDFRPNAYDLDSDGDGIVDVEEAGLADANGNGMVDGSLGTNGWSTLVSSLASLNLPNSEGVGNPDYLDIDSDGDGIPDNIEGMSTLGYKLPTTSDPDGDGLMNPYDNSVLYGGTGIFVYDRDGDTIPDYLDLDTDSDGIADIIEGNDFNLNGIGNDNVTPTGLDTDGDGLDNRFDSLNSVTNVKGTSFNMGTGGTITGDASPGTRSPVQKQLPAHTEREWRYVSYVLPVQVLNFTATLQLNAVTLNWSIVTAKDIDHFEIERSLTNANFDKVGVVTAPVKLNLEQNFNLIDNVAGINSEVIYYRLKVFTKAGEVKFSDVEVVRRSQMQTTVNVMPNPASDHVTVNVMVGQNFQGKISLVDKIGRKVLSQDAKFARGSNNISLGL
jgi:hypothetical protein